MVQMSVFVIHARDDAAPSRAIRLQQQGIRLLRTRERPSPLRVCCAPLDDHEWKSRRSHHASDSQSVNAHGDQSTRHLKNKLNTRELGCSVHENLHFLATVASSRWCCQRISALSYGEKRSSVGEGATQASQPLVFINSMVATLGT